MSLKPGNKADGDDFFDRVNERDDLWRYLEGNHIVPSGPKLAELMEESPYADFLKPISMALRAVDGAGDGVFAEAPLEIATMAEAVLAAIHKRQPKVA